MDILDTNRKGGPYETIQQFMKKSITTSDIELEWIYGSHPRNILKKPEFLKVLNYLRQNFKFKSETYSLSIYQVREEWSIEYQMYDFWSSEYQKILQDKLNFRYSDNNIHEKSFK